MTYTTFEKVISSKHRLLEKFQLRVCYFKGFSVMRCKSMRNDGFSVGNCGVSFIFSPFVLWVFDMKVLHILISTCFC